LTTSRRLALLVVAFLAWTPAAYAWSRPVQGPVLQPFVYDEAHPYAAGQHRGIDLGADAAGETVVAPAAGTVSFAGTVPTNGKSVTIETADGYSVTLTHLGSIAVAKGATVAEQDAVGAVGPSGTPEVDGPYVHLGIRVTADPNGYVDPLGLLPAAPEGSSDQSGSSAPAQPPSSSTAAAPAPAPPPPAQQEPAPSTPARSQVLPAGHAAGTRRASTREHGRRAQQPSEDARPWHASHLSKARDTRTPREVATPRSRPGERTRSLRRPFVEPARSESRTPAPRVQPRQDASDSPVGLACNGAAAMIALGAALAAGRRRRRGRAIPAGGAQVLHLAPPAVEQRSVSRAA